MKTEAKSENGSAVPRLEAKGTTTAGNISDRDLKILSLKFIGVCDGTYYFRDATDPTGPAYSGDIEDLKEHLAAKSAHPMVDAGTAAAVLDMRRLGKATTPFGTLATDEVGS